MIGRRSALKAAAALMSFPLLGDVRAIRSIPRWVIDRCCSNDWDRYDLAQPIIQNSTAFATNGYLMLAMDDAREYASNDPLGRYPDCVGALNRNWQAGRWRPWALDPVEVNDVWQTCTTCWGDGVIGEWSRIDGYAVVAAGAESFESGKWERVRRGGGVVSAAGRFLEFRHTVCVNGKLGEKCTACDGEGSWLGRQAFKFGDAILQAKAANLLSHVPDIEFCASSDPAAAISLRFPGGRGLVMPLEPKLTRPTGGRNRAD